MHRYLVQDHKFIDAFSVLLASAIAHAPTLAVIYALLKRYSHAFIAVADDAPVLVLVLVRFHVQCSH
jgi:thiaminase